MRFDWDAGNWPKCGRHGVSKEEIEDLFENDPLIVPDKTDHGAEERLNAIGTNNGGEHIFVVFTLRLGRIRPISARHMHDKEVKRYERDNP